MWLLRPNGGVANKNGCVSSNKIDSPPTMQTYIDFMEPKPTYGKREREEKTDQEELNDALCNACYDGDFDDALSLLEKGADPAAEQDGGWTALHSAAGHGNLDMVERLVNEGANVNAKNFKSETALHCACYKGADDVARFLTSVGANPCIKASNGKNCIDFAKENGHADLAVDMMAEFISRLDCGTVF